MIGKNCSSNLDFLFSVSALQLHLLTQAQCAESRKPAGWPAGTAVEGSRVNPEFLFQRFGPDLDGPRRLWNSPEAKSATSVGPCSEHYLPDIDSAAQNSS